MLLGDWMETLEQKVLFAHDPDTMDRKRIQGTIESKYCPADFNKWLKNVHTQNVMSKTTNKTTKRI